MGRFVRWILRHTQPRDYPPDQPLVLRPTQEDVILEKAKQEYLRLKREINEVLDNDHDRRRSES